MKNKDSKKPFQAVETTAPLRQPPQVPTQAKRREEDWVAAGEEGVPDDPFASGAAHRGYGPPQCRTCGQPKLLNRFGYCDDCTRKAEAKKLNTTSGFRANGQAES